MNGCLHASLIVFAFALGGCVFVSPPVPTTTPTVLSTVVCEREKCPCVSPILVEAWVDQNGNGMRDQEDAPMQGVRFRLQWLEEFDTCSTPYMASHYFITDATGHDFYALYGCACGTEELSVETPAGYKLVADRQGKCLFEAPESYGNHSMKGRPCLGYNFTPVAP